jgi:hypothetical protein
MKIVDVRTIELAEIRKQHELGTAPLFDLLKAEADLAESQVRAEMRKEELVKSPADTEIGRLAQQAREASLDLTQDEVRLKLLERKLDGLKKVRGLIDDYTEIAEHVVPALNRQLQEVQTRVLQGRTESP